MTHDPEKKPTLYDEMSGAIKNEAEARATLKLTGNLAAKSIAQEAVVRLGWPADTILDIADDDGADGWGGWVAVPLPEGKESRFHLIVKREDPASDILWNVSFAGLRGVNKEFIVAKGKPLPDELIAIFSTAIRDGVKHARR